MHSNPSSSDLQYLTTSSSAQSHENKEGNNWKQDIAFLAEYGYDLEKITPTSRIQLQHENSMNSTRGRSAPTVFLGLRFCLGGKAVPVFEGPPTVSRSGHSPAALSLLVQILRTAGREHCNLLRARSFS